MVSVILESGPALCARRKSWAEVCFLPFDPRVQKLSILGASSLRLGPRGLSLGPGKNTGVGCHSLLQGIFPTQGLILHLLHCRQILYQLSYQGKPRLAYSLLVRKRRSGPQRDSVFF